MSVNTEGRRVQAARLKKIVGGAPPSMATVEENRTRRAGLAPRALRRPATRRPRRSRRMTHSRRPSTSHSRPSPRRSSAGARTGAWRRRRRRRPRSGRRRPVYRTSRRHSTASVTSPAPSMRNEAKPCRCSSDAASSADGAPLLRIRPCPRAARHNHRRPRPDSTTKAEAVAPRRPSSAEPRGPASGGRGIDVRDDGRLRHAGFSIVESRDERVVDPVSTSANSKALTVGFDSKKHGRRKSGRSATPRWRFERAPAASQTTPVPARHCRLERRC